MALTKITKIGSNGLDEDVSAGGGGLNTTDTIDKLLFIHHGGFTADTTIGSPQKFSEIFSHVDATVDIDNGVTVSVDDESMLLITDKSDFDMNFMAQGASGTNLQRATKFDDNVRTSVTENISLTGIRKLDTLKFQLLLRQMFLSILIILSPSL